MIKAKVQVDMKPLQQLQKNQNRVLRKAIRNVSALLRSDMKQNAPADTGALKTSIGTRILNKKKTVLGIVGPRTRYSKTVKGVEKIPNQYAKMQEYKTLIQQGFVNSSLRRCPGLA